MIFSNKGNCIVGQYINVTATNKYLANFKEITRK